MICVICKCRGLISYMKYAAHAEYLGSEGGGGGKERVSEVILSVL